MVVVLSKNVDAPSRRPSYRRPNAAEEPHGLIPGSHLAMCHGVLWITISRKWGLCLLAGIIGALDRVSRPVSRRDRGSELGQRSWIEVRKRVIPEAKGLENEAVYELRNGLVLDGFDHRCQHAPRRGWMESGPRSWCVLSPVRADLLHRFFVGHVAIAELCACKSAHVCEEMANGARLLVVSPVRYKTLYGSSSRILPRSSNFPISTDTSGMPHSYQRSTLDVVSGWPSLACPSAK